MFIFDLKLSDFKFQCKITEDMLEELLFFADEKFPNKTIEDFANNKLCFGLLLKRSSETLTGNIDEVVSQAIYGNSRKPPGDENSPSRKLRQILEFKPESQEPTKEEIFNNVLLGIWAPPNTLTRGAVLKLIFPSVSGPYRLPDLKATPLHVAVAYDAFKAKEVMDLSAKYPGQVINYGYFSNDIPGEAQLIAKTTEKFEARSAPTTYEEKIVIQLAKEIPECYMDFNELGPSYISRDVEVGEKDCSYFFPPDYNTPEVEIINFLKKKTKRKGKFGKITVPQEILENQNLLVGGENASELTSQPEVEAEGEADEATVNDENIDDNESQDEELLEAEGKEDIEDEELANAYKKEFAASSHENDPKETGSADKATSPAN